MDFSFFGVLPNWRTNKPQQCLQKAFITCSHLLPVFYLLPSATISTTSIMCTFLQINWIALLKWFIYLLAACTACLAIVVFVLDQMDTDRALQEREDANSKRNSSSSSAAKADSQTKNNIILGLLMLSSTAPASFHYCSPRLFFIALMVVLSALTLICRALLAAVFRAQYLSTVIVSALAGCLYFYLVAFRAKDPADSSWKTFVQPNSRELGSGAGSSAGEDNVQVIVVRKPKKRKTATKKSAKSEKSEK